MGQRRSSRRRLCRLMMLFSTARACRFVHRCARSRPVHRDHAGKPGGLWGGAASRHGDAAVVPGSQAPPAEQGLIPGRQQIQAEGRHVPVVRRNPARGKQAVHPRPDEKLAIRPSPGPNVWTAGNAMAGQVGIAKPASRATTGSVGASQSRRRQFRKKVASPAHTAWSPSVAGPAIILMQLPLVNLVELGRGGRARAGSP